MKKNVFVLYVDDEGHLTMNKFDDVKMAGKDILKVYKQTRAVPTSVIIGEAFDCNIDINVKLEEKT